MSLEHTGHTSATTGVDFEEIYSDYFQHRQPKKGAAGWVLLIGLGVAYVISSDYAGWNFSFAQGGWGGMFLATLLMATVYLCMCLSLAELSSMISTAGGSYAYSRQLFTLSRAGYLPRRLSLTNSRKAPVPALVVSGVTSFGLSLTGQGDLLILVAVFGATLSYVLMMVAHITLRIRRPDMQRPYHTPGGILTSGTALVLLRSGDRRFPSGSAGRDRRDGNLLYINRLLRPVQPASLGVRHPGRGVLRNPDRGKSLR